MIERLRAFIKRRGQKQFFKEVAIALVLLSMPSWYLLRHSFPDGLETIEAYDLTLTSLGFPDLHIMIWVSTLKLIPICILIIWIFSCRYWWRFALFIPLLFSIFQFIHMLISDRYFDNKEILYSLLMTLPMFVLLIWLFSKTSVYNKYDYLGEEIQKEINISLSLLKIKNQESFATSRKHFEDIKDQKLFLTSEEYNYKLIALRNKILIHSHLNKE